MGTKDLLNPDQQIGKKVRSDPQRSRESHDEDLSAIKEQQKLFVGLMKGEIKTVIDCLCNGADMFGTDLHSQTALHFAAKGCCLEILKFVSKFSIDLSAVDINHQSALHVASFNGRPNIVEYLIKDLKASINRRDINGRTPLHLAAINGHKDVIECLLKHQDIYKITAKDIFGNTALHYAAIQNQADIVSILLEKEQTIMKTEKEINGEIEGKDYTNKTFFGASVLHLASENGHKNLVEILLKKINVNLRSDLNYVPLHYAARGGHLDIMKFLITNGANVNAQSLHGTTPLHLAARKEHEEVVKELLHHAADINATDLDGSTPLSLAVAAGHLTISKLLLKKGAVVDSTNNRLYLAAAFGHHELVETLLHKCDSSSKLSALHWAAYKGHITIVKKLVSNDKNIEGDGKGCTALHLAAFQGHTDMVRFLISNGYDVNAKIIRNDFEETFSDEDDDNCDTVLDGDDLNDASQLLSILDLESGETALHLSSLQKHKDTVRFLLKNQADICIKDDTDTTPLQIIIETGMTEILIEEKVPVNSAEYDDLNPLQLGAQQGDLEFVKYCVLNGCDTNARSKISDFSALDLAVINGHTEVVEYVIECKVKSNVEFSDVTTALKFSVQENRKDILNILLNENLEISDEKEREYLLLAISSGHEDIVELFLKRNPENGVSKPLCHEFPLHTAVSLGHLNIVKRLLEGENRECINYKIENFATPLQIASNQGYCEIARILLTKGADPNMPDKFLPLNVAVRNGDLQMVQVLIRFEANITLRDADGFSALELAVICKNQEIIETLLEHSPIDINFKGLNDLTLMHHAANSGSLQIVKSLIDKGAAINSRDCTGSKPIHKAAKKGHQDIIEYFLRKGLDIDDREFSNFWSLLHYAAAGDHSDLCKFLLTHGMNVNVVDAYGCTPLHVAAEKGKIAVLHTLLHYGAYYDVLNENNETPIDVATTSTLHNNNIRIVASLKFIELLFSAVEENDVLKVEDLLKEGLRISEYGYANIKFDKNVSLLYNATVKGYDEMISLLLKYNADPNSRADDGCTPLHYAARFSHTKIAKTLLQNGAMFDVECKDKKTPRDYATDIDVTDLLDFLQAMFSKIRNKEKLISNSLAGLEDLDIVKAVMRAKNLSGKTLIAFSVLKEHPEAESLKWYFQSSATLQRQRAIILQNEGKLEESFQEYKIILEKRIGLFGEEDIGVLDIQEAMFKLLLKQEKYDEAEIMIKNIYKIRREILGDCNKETITAMKLMASIFGLKGRKKEALHMCEEVLIKQREVFGSDEAETLLTQILMIQLMCEEESANGNLTKALKLCQMTLEKIRKVPEVTDFILKLKLQVANQLTNLGKFSESLDILNEVLEIQKGKLGLYHAKTSDTYIHTLFLMGEEDSLNAFNETYEIRKRVLGRNNSKTLHSHYWVANVLFLQRMFHEAYEIYKRDLESRIVILGKYHPDILETQERMKSIVSHIIFY